MNRDNFYKLEKNIIHLFSQINSNNKIYISKPSQGLGLHIVFKNENIRSSIRIYGTNKENVFIYAVGNKQQYLLSDELLQKFYHDFKIIKYNFDNHIFTRPIDKLIQQQKEGIRQKEFQETLLSQELHFIQKKEEYLQHS